MRLRRGRCETETAAHRRRATDPQQAIRRTCGALTASARRLRQLQDRDQTCYGTPDGFAIAPRTDPLVAPRLGARRCFDLKFARHGSLFFSGNHDCRRQSLIRCMIGVGSSVFDLRQHQPSHSAFLWKKLIRAGRCVPQSHFVREQEFRAPGLPGKRYTRSLPCPVVVSRLPVPIDELVDVFEPEVGHREIHAVTRAAKAVLAIKISVGNRECNKREY